MLSETEKMEALINLGMELNEIKDLDILMEHILTAARRFANTDAGSIYLRNDNRLKFSYTQNDTLQKRLQLGAKLIYNIFDIPMDQNSLAGYAAVSGNSVNIDDTEKIDPESPFHFNRSFDEASGYFTRSILTIPLKTTRNDVVGVLQMINARNDSGSTIPFSPESEKLMRLFAGMAGVALERAKMTREMILRTIRMAEMRDPTETGAHVNRVAGYSLEIYETWASKNSVDREEVEGKRDILRMAAMLHDVGKVAIPDAILKKPAKLSEEEFRVMKEHTWLGSRLFSDKSSDFDEAASEVALNHHERWDGKGYPGYIDVETGKPTADKVSGNGAALGKKAGEIPLFGRIVAIADVYDALASKRSYKESWDEKEIMKVIEESKGTHFDPELIDCFYACFDSIKQVQKRYPYGEEI